MSPGHPHFLSFESGSSECKKGTPQKGCSFFGAADRTRTGTELPPADFKSAVSTIPPQRRGLPNHFSIVSDCRQVGRTALPPPIRSGDCPGKTEESAEQPLSLRGRRPWQSVLFPVPLEPGDEKHRRGFGLPQPFGLRNDGGGRGLVLLFGRGGCLGWSAGSVTPPYREVRTAPCTFPGQRR